MPQFYDLIKNRSQVNFINICTFYLHVQILLDNDDESFLVKKKKERKKLLKNGKEQFRSQNTKLQTILCSLSSARL